MNNEFDLNAAIRNWRENLNQSPQFRAENLDELEAHLRDAIATMQGHRLTDEEVFLIATRRLGGVHALEPEFAKINAREVWLNRALWMLLGIQLWTVLSGLARPVAIFAVVGGLIGSGRDLSDAPGQTWAADIAILFGVAQVAALGLAIWCCSWFVRRRGQGLRTFTTKILSRRGSAVLTVAGVCLVLLAIKFFGFVEPAVLAKTLDLQRLGFLMRSEMWSSLALSLVQMVALAGFTVVVARRLLVIRKQTA